MALYLRLPVRRLPMSHHAPVKNSKIGDESDHDSCGTPKVNSFFSERDRSNYNVKGAALRRAELRVRKEKARNKARESARRAL